MGPLGHLELEVALVEEILGNDAHRVLDRSCVGVDVDFGVLGLLVRCRDTGELLDFAGLGLLVETLGVTALARLDAGVDKHLDKGKLGHMRLVELPCDLAVRLVRRDERGDGDRGGRRKEQRDLRDAADVLLAVLGREAEVLVEAKADVVTIKTVRRLLERQQVLLERSGDRRLARRRQSGKPDRESLLRQQLGALVVRDVARVERDVGRHGECVKMVTVCGVRETRTANACISKHLPAAARSSATRSQNSKSFFFRAAAFPAAHFRTLVVCLCGAAACAWRVRLNFPSLDLHLQSSSTIPPPLPVAQADRAIHHLILVSNDTEDAAKHAVSHSVAASLAGGTSPDTCSYEYSRVVDISVRVSTAVIFEHKLGRMDTDGAGTYEHDARHCRPQQGKATPKAEEGRLIRCQERACRSWQSSKPALTPSTSPSRLTVEEKQSDFGFDYYATRAALFRYSAVTFNAHRIHLDPEYCRNEEGHPDCLVHGPLTATLLLNLIAAAADKASGKVQKFEYRATSPLTVEQRIRLRGAWEGSDRRKASLWALNEAGTVCMTAKATLKAARVGHLDLGVILVKVDRDAVYAVTLVGGRVESLTLENVTEVTAAGLASDLDPLHSPAAVDVAVDGAWNGVEEGRPSTARVELGRSLFDMPLGNDSGAAWDEAVDPILKAAGIEDEKERNEEAYGLMARSSKSHQRVFMQDEVKSDPG
ncbi:hypothetical protein L1887_59345 [Cichorium endivia]|nr:hypothetical protein L1887_59345 [Cichorium endivia]